MKNTVKIIVLWGIILWSLVFHSLLETMPLFFCVDIAMPGATGVVPESKSWMCLILYLLPMMCLISVVYCTSIWFRISNLVLVGLFVVFNAYHLIVHLAEASTVIQPLLLSFILVANVLLFFASLCWVRKGECK